MLNDIKDRLTNLESIIKNYDININKNTKLNDNNEEFKICINKEKTVNNNDNITNLLTSIDKNNKINIKDYDGNIYIINSIIITLGTILLVIGLTWYRLF